ncbi:MAG: hypothetical protein JXR48_16975 [Candidatus Delongbacteria bacterium]|nr:hypothetical protein [Candidatus Delongbacteria bacterium]MBN2836651.1 hypothetical protein [Candidatus Delongbacteria bacterium]
MLQRLFKVVIVLLAVLFFLSCFGLQFLSSSSISGPPYYRGQSIDANGKIGYLPTVFDLTDTFAFGSNYDSDTIENVRNLVDSYIDSLQYIVKLEKIDLPIENFPNVYIKTERAKGDDSPIMMMGYGNPSQEWKEAIKKIMIENELDYLVFPKIGVGTFKVTQNGFFTNKVIKIGTKYSVKTNWATSTDDPVQGVIIGGLLFNKDGEIVKYGLEGIAVNSSSVGDSFFSSITGGMSIFSPENIEKSIMKTRCDDIKNKPLRIKVAINNFLSQLTNNPKIFIN